MCWNKLTVFVNKWLEVGGGFYWIFRGGSNLFILTGVWESACLLGGENVAYTRKILTNFSGEYTTIGSFLSPYKYKFAIR